MHVASALILALLAPLGQALPSPIIAPTAALRRSDTHIPPAGHGFAASANHKPRLVRRKKAGGKRSACVVRGPGPVVIHQSVLGAGTNPSAPASTSSAAASATSTASAIMTAPVQSASAVASDVAPETASSSSASAASSSIVAHVGLANPSSSALASSSTAVSSTAASPAPTSPAQTSSLMDNIFPVRGTKWWSTSTEATPNLSFTGALKPLTAGSLPSTSNAPDGASALVANYPAGTVKYSASTGHGFSFYTEGNHNGVSVEGAKEVIFSYSVYFQSGFDFVKGGKMPGLYGGTSLSAAKSCSGGRQDSRDECFSARLMWRTNGMGEIYNYFPTSVQQGGGYCETSPKSICDTVFGDSIGRGSYTWATGAWTTVAQRIKLNDVGVANGEQQLWVNGQPIMHLTGLQLIVKDAKIYGIMAQTFFGGSDQSWASTQDQSAWFKDWSLAVIS